jgi:hypothetical protein
MLNTTDYERRYPARVFRHHQFTGPMLSDISSVTNGSSNSSQTKKKKQQKATKGKQDGKGQSDGTGKPASEGRSGESMKGNAEKGDSKKGNGQSNVSNGSGLEADAKEFIADLRLLKRPATQSVLQVCSGMETETRAGGGQKDPHTDRQNDCLTD